MTISLDDTKAAAELIQGKVIRTPLVAAPRLATELECGLHLKLENLQATGSFKDRGACVKLLGLDADERRAGVIAMSAGNHAQGVAYRAQELGIPATIVMPEFAPFSKVSRTRGFGARVVLSGETLDASAVAAREIAEKEGQVFVHPYDDPRIVAGQGTMGLEILADNPAIDTLVVPIGGGGMIAGIATAVKAMKPEVTIYGVEAELYPSMYQAINRLAPTAGGQTLADGIAVKNPGAITRPIIEALVDDIILVDEAAIEAAVQALVEQQKVVAEGAGAAGLAAVMTHGDRFAGRQVAVVVGGGNIDVRLLSWVLTRGLVRDGRMVRLRIGIVDRPGVLAQVAGLIGRTGGNIIEVYHQRLFFDVPAKQADVDVIVETRDSQHVHEIVETLQTDGFPTRVLTSRSDAGLV